MTPRDPARPMRNRRLTIEVTQACNFNCAHCFNRPGEAGEAPSPSEAPSPGAAPSPSEIASLDLDAICGIVEQAYGLGCRDVLLTGGEPLAWPHFARFYETLTRYADLSIKINTNASRIDEPLADLLAHRPPDNIHIGLYGWDEASYTAVTGNPKGFALARRGIGLLAQKGLRFTLILSGIRLLAENQDRVDAFAASLGAEQVVRGWLLGGHVYRDPARSALIQRARLTPREAAQGMIRAKGGVDQLIQELLKPSPRDFSCLFSCLRSYQQVIVDPRLNLLPCIILRHPDYTFSLRSGSLAEGLAFVERLSWLPHRRTDEQERCGSCQVRGICRHCPANAYLEHGDFEGIGEYYCQVTREVSAMLGLPRQAAPPG